MRKSRSKRGHDQGLKGDSRAEFCDCCDLEIDEEAEGEDICRVCMDYFRDWLVREARRQANPNMTKANLKKAM